MLVFVKPTLVKELTKKKWKILERDKRYMTKYASNK